jgi:transcription initiation factor IIF auxiliary subunit
VREALTVDVKDSPFDPDLSELVIRVRQTPSDQPLYQVFLYLDGPDLPFVRSVTYRLHPTFASPVRTVARTARNPRCKLAIWTWGLFEVTATIVDKEGQEYLRSHQLDYDRHFSRSEVRFLAS